MMTAMLLISGGGLKYRNYSTSNFGILSSLEWEAK